MTDVRRALREELEARGLVVADDTFSSRGQIYVEADNDLSAGLFEFHDTVIGAIETMYQGRWTEDLPPRFVVLPARASADPSFELLEQMRIIPVVYESEAGVVRFTELDAALHHLRS